MAGARHLSNAIGILVPWTCAIYLGFFFVFGEEVFNTDFGPQENSTGVLDGIIDFFADTFDLIGDIGQFITLGGFSSPLHITVQAVLFLSVSLGWLLVALGLGRGTAVS